MKILVFDTETTGLPEKNASMIATYKWPYIVQLSYILYDTDENIVLNFVDEIIKLPNNVVISKESENIHKISNEISRTKGVDIKKELSKFNNIISKADIIVGHNILFDKNMITVECIRNKLDENLINSARKPEFCTMKKSVNICKIMKVANNGDKYYKYPKLFELHQHLFGTIPDGLHNSIIDVLVCLRCYGMINYNIDYFEKSKSLKSLNKLYSEKIQKI